MQGLTHSAGCDNMIFFLRILPTIAGRTARPVLSRQHAPLREGRTVDPVDWHKAATPHRAFAAGSKTMTKNERKHNACQTRLQTRPANLNSSYDHSATDKRGAGRAPKSYQYSVGLKTVLNRLKTSSFVAW